MTRDPGKPRGILRHAPVPGVFHHARIAPSSTVAWVVQHFWTVSWDLQGGPPQARQTLPHPNAHLVLDPGRTRVHGVHSGRFARVLEGKGCVFGVKFRPGGLRPFLQGSVSALRNRSLSLEEVFGAAAAGLEAAVFNAGTDEERVAVAGDFLAARLPPLDGNVVRVGEIVDGIAVDRGINTLDHVLSRWPMDRRTLQRLFNEYVGIGPKWVINRYRMHEALERAEQGGQANWAELALELGYFDQAHFIRDFKALVGCTPARYADLYRPERWPLR